MKISFSILLFCCIPFLLPGQTMKAFKKAGDKAFKNKDYNAALEYYRNALEFDEDNPALTYQYAEVARLFHAFEIAEAAYKKVLGSDDADRFPLTKYALGLVKKQTGQYEQAANLFSDFIKEDGSANTVYKEKADRELKNCKWALEVVQQPHNIKIDQLNKRVNTGYSEFGALMKGDTLYYSSYRFPKKGDEHQPPRLVSKVLTSVKGSRGRIIRRDFNSETLHTAHNTFSKNGQLIYYTVCNYVGAADIRCELYTRKKGRRNRWTKPVKLGPPVNEKGFTTTHPQLVVETSGREVLYFVSDRPGGKGKLDIWYSVLKKDGGFEKPVNLEAINTEENDITPFYHTATQTLFFSSDGYQGLGGYDIYQVQQKGSEWMAVVHTGFPLNSSYNDLYYTLDRDSTIGYLSSNRLGSMYLEKNNKACCNDIYKVKILPEEQPLEPEPEPTDSLLLDPPVAEADPLPPVIEPELPPLPPPPSTLEEFLPLALYFDNDEPDKRTRKTTTRKAYEETYLPYYRSKPVYMEEYVDPLPETVRYEAERAMEDFFEQKVKKGYDYLFLFSDILLTRLQKGETVEIFIKGFTSPRAKKAYNLALGKRRISSVRNHFRTFSGGILKPYLETGQLKVSEKSFGETTASTTISDDLNDRRNSVYSVVAALERRVEIVEIRRN